MRAGARAGGPLVRRLTAGEWFTLALVALALIAAGAVAAGAVAIVNQADARGRVVDQVDPARRAADQLVIAVLNQETGVRGYALSADASFLRPYRSGRAQERTATRALNRAIAPLRHGQIGADAAAALAAVREWQARYALPTIALVRDGSLLVNPKATDAGRRLFDVLRARFARVQADLGAERARDTRRLSSAAGTLTVTFIVVGALIVLLAGLILVTLRNTVTRPVARLARDTRRVAQGDFAQPIAAQGARDIAQLGADVESMRERIVGELAAAQAAGAELERQQLELERSNAELEQFAYVASHDLQEPLRKVASFTQLLQKRYGGQLDERADEYIEFAADGAKRMAILINDLLAFSRVGRLSADEVGAFGADAALDDALSALAQTIEEAPAAIDRSPLPGVRGERALIAAVFQNLVGNALKFRSPERPLRITIAARRERDDWVFTCSDNGIGVAPDYAERIFLIFQRLHPKSAYPGTGIGLALCRKIVEYHDGRIWLDTDARPGATFHFTLPVPGPDPPS